jgi:hypothetical protein
MVATNTAALISDLQWEPGKILGTDYKIPPNMERLKGWVIAAVYPEEGTVSLFAPKELAEKKKLPDEVPYSEAEKFIAHLRASGHPTAHLLRERDAEAMNDLRRIDWRAHNENLSDIVGFREIRFAFSHFQHWGERVGAKDPLIDPSERLKGAIAVFPIVVSDRDRTMTLPYAAVGAPAPPSESERGYMAYAYTMVFGRGVVANQVNVNQPVENSFDQYGNAMLVLGGRKEQRVQPRIELPTGIVVAVQDIPVTGLGRPQPM